MTCPQCGSSEIRASRTAHWSDTFQRIRGRQPFRCRECRRRFFASKASASGTVRAVRSESSRRPRKLIGTQARKRLVRRLILISVFAVAFGLFLLFLRYFTSERDNSIDSGMVSSPGACSLAPTG